ncbi:MAG: Ig-like domain-containing protein [Candidatus Bathyarchaeia archaeon]|jgi:hypothetical protein
MNFLNYQKAAVFLFIVLLAVCMIPVTALGNIEKTYTIQPPSTRQYGIINVQPRLLSSGHNQKLYVSTPTSLVNYYGNLTHSINDNSDYANFVTPQVVAPIADSIMNVTDNLPHQDEQFADAVLGFVHQFTYNVTNPQYPVETLSKNMGDCVGLSLLTASIMEAGGLDVVLILYTGINPQHMNVGVYLPYTPVYHTSFMTPTSFTYDNKTYWTAETTPEGNWKVGDQSQTLANAIANIIPLNSTTESLPPAEISAGLNKNLINSTITLNLSQQATSTDVNGERSLLISGSITPAVSGQTVNVYVSSSNYEGEVLNFLTTTTDNAGNYSLTWNFTTSGTYYVTASWNGGSNYAGADSQMLPIFVGPQSYLQFNSVDYNYIFGEPGLAAFATIPMQGANDFLTLPLGTNASLSYKFIVLRAGQTISNVPTINITVPAMVERVLLSRGRVATIEVPSHNETVPLSVPQGLAPLMLSDDFNQTLDNQFSLILQNNAGNFSLNLKGLSQEDILNMQGSAAITNATGSIKQNIWYSITTKISGNNTTTNLSYENGTVIESANSQNSNNSTVLLITNNEDTAIALKNLTIQTQTPIAKEPQTTQKPSSILSTPNLPLYTVVAVLVAATILSALYVKRAKKHEKPSSH